jgi:hypothetical protein
MYQTLFVQSIVPITIIIILVTLILLSVIVPTKVPTIILVRRGALVEFERIVGHPRHIVGLLIVVVIIDATCHGEQTLTHDGVGRDGR